MSSPATRRRATLVAGTVIVVATCVALGVWQLGRLADRKAVNDRFAARAARVAEPLGATTSLGVSADAYRRVVAEGTYDATREIVLRARSLRGRAGNHVLTPLRLTDGTAILVDRGWVPLDAADPPVREAAPPAGQVRVTGILLPAERRAPLAAGDTAAGRLTTIGHVDLARIGREVPYALAPLWLSLERQEPPARVLPVAAGYRPPGDGPHFSYAVQWFVFAAIALVTGVLLLRKEVTMSEPRLTAYSHGAG